MLAQNLAAKVTNAAAPIQIIQLESGPVLKTNVSVQPKFAAKLQATNAYTDNTAGPINAATIAPNCCAVSAAQTPTRSKTKPLPCSTTVGQEREFSALKQPQSILAQQSLRLTFCQMDACRIPKVVHERKHS